MLQTILNNYQLLITNLHEHLEVISIKSYKKIQECHIFTIATNCYSQHPVSEKGVEFTNALKLKPLPVNKINSDDFQGILDWSARFGRSVIQRSGKQGSTMVKDGTLLEGFYQSNEQLRKDVPLDATQN